MDPSIIGVYTIISSRGTKISKILCSLQTLQMFFLFQVCDANDRFFHGVFSSIVFPTLYCMGTELVEPIIANGFKCKMYIEELGH
jgi:hypothetical protein